MSLRLLQLISSDADGAIQRAGRFRVENGSSDEVNAILYSFSAHMTSLSLFSRTSGFTIFATTESMIQYIGMYCEFL